MSGEYVKILGAERIKMEWIAPKSKRGESQRTEKGTVADEGEGEQHEVGQTEIIKENDRMCSNRASWWGWREDWKSCLEIQH